MKRRYDIHTNGKNLVVVTTYYGNQIFRGVAKCAPEDEYNDKLGIDLATARCKKKLFTVKRHVAVSKRDFYDQMIKKYTKLRDEAVQYATDCSNYIEQEEATIAKLTSEND